MFEFFINTLTTLASFLFVFTIVVFFHELGHFSVARWCGVRVDTFSIGFGNTLVSWRDKHGTVWRIASLPLGGYVKFFGDASGASNPDTTHLERMRESIETQHGREAVATCFHFKPVWQRAAVLAAGPGANFILAIVIFAVTFGLLGESHLLARVGAVTPGAAAEEAGFQPGDQIVSANGREIQYFSDVQNFVMLRGGDTVSFGVERDGELLTLDATLGQTQRQDLSGRPVTIGFLGIAPRSEAEDFVSVRHGPVSAIGRGLGQTWMVVEQTGRYVGRIFQGRENGDQLGGPLRMANMAGDIGEQAFSSNADRPIHMRLLMVLTAMLMLAGFLSVGIGLLNLLPIPILDGGHLLYYGYEAVMGRPLGENAQEWGFRVGLALVLGMMAFVTFNDVRYFGWLKAIADFLTASA